jgi:dTDP-4-amino-4,6-dideoxygalactose transaminase
MIIPFTKPYLTGLELEMLTQSLAGPKLSGNGPFTSKCQNWLCEHTSARKTLLTQSCTSALEMASLLLSLQPGDEVIMPSFTFSSSATAFVLRGAVPVFVDIRPDTLNLDETSIEQAITPRTKAIVPVHYAGVACEMDTILAIAEKYQIPVIADSAQALMSQYKGRALPALGNLAALSFHDTKNISCGEGGALLVSDPNFIERAEILWEKGTDRSRFLRGEIDKYTWVDVGSSFLPSELTASVLFAQLSRAQEITAMRMRIWQDYHHKTLELEQRGFLKRPTVPVECTHNAHIFYVLLDPRFSRASCLDYLKTQGIQAVSHYVPLHSSPAGRRFGRSLGELIRTDSLSEQLIRLPLWPGFTECDRVITALREFCEKPARSRS